MSITKAIIPVAGFGTRRLPITKAIEKCMLPIGNRPIVDYAVQDCIAAGITEIIFIIGEQSEQLQTYYGQNSKLNEYLSTHAKEYLLSEIQPLSGVTFHYVQQPASGKHGTAAAVALAKGYLQEGERAAVIMGDDFIYNADGSSETARLINTIGDEECGLLAATIELKPGGTYGLIVRDNAGYYQKIVDQPTVADNPPSNLINISKYILNKEIIELADQLPPAYNGEYQLPDAINQYVERGGKVKVVPAVGEYLDGGSLAGWLHANQVVGSDLLKS